MDNALDILTTMPAPTVRTDLVDVYVFRVGNAETMGQDAPITFLQMRRTEGPMKDTWQPVMGHIRSRQADGRTPIEDETATDAAIRELAEETGYRPAAGLLGLWQLETVSPYFLASQNCVMMSPCFAAQVPTNLDPVLNHEHNAFRWVGRDLVDRAFIWPGQRVAINQIVRDILPDVAADPSDESIGRLLRIDLTNR